ncbi:MAG: beta-CASP ribonuclease aCPSF1 [Thaumarchaeota archaeon]|nr:beta-CASP ribonuclease aCPSF1 [Nitrososphaerota archaeon]|tara:strand:+ start:1080 stop:3014 length:1935 start_codon:yes stop_codon:yes gene_type:complete
MMQENTGEQGYNIMSIILQSIPSDAAITKIEYEGPMIALYTKNPKYLMENNQIISNMVNMIKKRIIVRTDESIRKSEEDARNILIQLLPKDAEVKSTFFDTALGEITVEVKKPWIVNQPDTSTNDFNMIELINKTGWKIRVKKASHIQSEMMKQVNYTLKMNANERNKFYKYVGDQIFRPKLDQTAEASLLTLGGFGEVGRSCMLLTTHESKILLDCGINPGARESLNAFPRLDWANIELDELDAIVISHAHLDHTGFLPVIFKYGYKGPIYCSEPTLPLMTLIQNDMIKVAMVEGKIPLYTERDIKEVIKHTITLPYGMVTDIAPDVKLVLSNAGHILGSSTMHLHIGNGDHNLVYAADLKYGRSQMFESASWNYPRVETLIIESTYGAKEDIMPSREEVEMNFVNTINRTLTDGGKVLIPVPAVGRAQEILMVIDSYMKAGKMIEAPVFIEGMISEATAMHVANPEYLARELRQRIMETDDNPFMSEYFTIIERADGREEALRDGPAITMATSGMLEGGPVIEYFKALASNPKNRVVFVSYQVNGTLGRRVLDGSKQVSVMGREGKIEVININCGVEKIEGFSGHSDYNQLISYVGKLRPKLRRVIVNHGERRKVENVASAVGRIFKIHTNAPSVKEAIRLL